MTFGQSAGPPASQQQVAELLELLGQAGYETFREARHPFGLSQRQSNGKFSRQEASELIDRLAGAEAEGAAAEPILPHPTDAPTPGPDAVAMAFPDEMLADELARRGWTCTPPGEAP